MATSATTRTAQDPLDFIAAVVPQRRREEAAILLDLMTKATGSEAFMYGPSIVGFGLYAYRYPTGNSGDYIRVGFSPRKAALTVYGLRDQAETDARLGELGPHTTGSGCVYIKRLDQIVLAVLSELVAASYVPKVHEVTE